ncbi:glycoside hydrolase family 19 protein [Bradyrhizobium sp. SZCCHNRI1002]|uniref:glycoside hydrolase family 19 protein n=1 Tax=Bradyrhizobium sp. SZCCHNRI1002 TaxID=3057274 RepID=UPI0028E3373D|nr:glycoside hydrolase family 19 protein [Bradyrhizobium sp. SZCCHNRI1002]
MFDQQRFGAALMRLWPHGDDKIPGLRKEMIAQSPTLFDLYGLTSPLVIANFMGECTVECGGGSEVEENLNYREEVLLSQWPKHFTPAQAKAMAHQPRLIANQAYNGRMGNRLGSDDGWTYRGRGPAQTTGRDAYGHLGEMMGLDFVNHPELINQPEYFLEAGLIDFVTICGCLPYAERDDEINETRCLNGGLIGLAQRQQSIALWKQAFGLAA